MVETGSRPGGSSSMNRLGIAMPRSEIARSLEEAEQIVERIGLPAVIRPAYTMGGTGGGLVFYFKSVIFTSTLRRKYT